MAASPLQAADEAPVVLEPSSPWNVDFGEDKCRLARTFGGEGNRHVLFFEQGGPASYFGFTVAGPQLERFRSARIAIRFGEHPVIEVGQHFTGTVESFGPALIYSGMVFVRDGAQNTGFGQRLCSLPEIDLVQAAKVTKISIRKSKREVIFNTGKLTEPVNVLNQCAQCLLNSWGLDLERHRTVKRIPIWINEYTVARAIQASYPESALSKGEQAIIRMRVIVDENGKVAECKLIETTLAKSLDSPACTAMRRARFEPALDRNGQPMRSYYMTNIIYRVN